MTTRFDRRAFVLGGSLCLGGLCAASRPRSRETKRTLVLIQLSGGNDGLSTLVPYADDAYGRERRTFRFGPGDVLRIDERVGLHPLLRGLRELHEGDRK